MRVRSWGNRAGTMVRLSGAEVAFLDLLIRVNRLLDEQETSAPVADRERAQALLQALECSAQHSLITAQRKGWQTVDRVLSELGAFPPLTEEPPEEGVDGITLSQGPA